MPIDVMQKEHTTDFDQLQYIFLVLILLLVFPIGFLILKAPGMAEGGISGSVQFLGMVPIESVGALPAISTAQKLPSRTSGQVLSSESVQIFEEFQEPRFVWPQQRLNLDNEEIIHINFYGGAKPLSRIDKGNVVLIAAEKSKWAYAKLDFKLPVDLMDDSIVFLARGANGTELLKIAVIDVNRRTSHASDIASIQLTTEWQEVIISKDTIDIETIDISRISHVKFAIDPKNLRASAGSAIYIKDIALLQYELNKRYRTFEVEKGVGGI